MSRQPLPLLPAPATRAARRDDSDQGDLPEQAAQRVLAELGGLFTGCVLTLSHHREQAADCGFDLEFWGDRGLRAGLRICVAASRPGPALTADSWSLDVARSIASGANPQPHVFTFATAADAWRFICLAGQLLCVAQVRLNSF